MKEHDCQHTQPPKIVDLPKKCEHEYGAVAVDAYTEPLSKEDSESGEYAHSGAMWFDFCPNCGEKL